MCNILRNNSVQLEVGGFLSFIFMIHSRFSIQQTKNIHKDGHKCLNRIGQNIANCWSSFFLLFQGYLRATKAFMSSFYTSQLNFIHQRSVRPLFHSDSKYSKRTIPAHSVTCSRMPSYSNNCACSEGACRVRYCDNHAQKM